MVRAAQVRRVSAGLIHHRHRMMPANIEKRAQLIVAAAHHYHWLASHRRGNILSRFFNLLFAPHRLPRPRENILQLQIGDARIGVPRRRNRVRFGQRSGRIVRSENFFHRLFHAISPVDLRERRNRRAIRFLHAYRALQHQQKLIDPHLVFLRVRRMREKSWIEFLGEQRVLKTFHGPVQNRDDQR